MELFPLSSLVLFFAGIGFGLLIYAGDRKSPVTRWWFGVSAATALWGLSLYGVTTSADYRIALWWQYFLDITAIFIPALYINFILSFLRVKRSDLRWFFLILAGVISIFSFSLLFKKGITDKFGFHWIDPGPLYFIFPIYFTVTVVVAIYFLIKTYRTTADSLLKKQALYTLLAGLVGFGGGITNFFPQLFNVYPFGNYFIVAYVVLMSYSVLQHRLFNVKVIATQFFISALWIFILIQLLRSEGYGEHLINTGLLASTIFVGVLLIRAVIKEVSAREKIQALAEELATANLRLKELDRQKSEFVSIASHQLRSPLTAIKGYSSMLLEGSFGPVGEKAREAVDRIFQSSNKLVVIIEDFLNITRIELGRMKYELSKFDLKNLVSDIVKELQPNIEKKPEIRFSYERPEDDYFINADYGKISQVVSNLIDNSLKYTPKGFVKVRLEKITLPQTQHPYKLENVRMRLSVADSGIGIAPVTMQKLFEKFSRAEDASRQNRQGTGLGLYVAKQIMDAHHGKIWAESPGEGMGATFYLEFSAAPENNNFPAEPPSLK